MSAAGIAVAVAAYWYASPYLALHWMKSAVESRDADAFNRRVDFAKLRAHVKEQLAATMSDRLGQASQDAGARRRAGGALGAMLGSALLEPLVDNLVSPETVMRALQTARFDAAANGDPSTAVGRDTGRGDGRAAGGNAIDAGRPHVAWSSERVDIDTLIVSVGQDAPTPAGRVRWVMERSGFADWRLTDIRWPIER